MLLALNSLRWSHVAGGRHLSRRGLAAVDSEWKLVCATHNLLKLWHLNAMAST